MTAYYNEIDPFAAEWLQHLITAGFIAPGDVDTRSIEDVLPSDLRGYTQCHFFAGIGVWSHALRTAGWSDGRPVWTGSCPCQPFSAAGKRGGTADERHLWPAFHHLIAECRPDVVVGEQVASRDGLAWLDLVHADMEGADYAFGALDLCAAGVGAPHIRQRLWWVGVAECGGERLERRDARPLGLERTTAERSGETGRLADRDGERLGETRRTSGPEAGQSIVSAERDAASGVELPSSERRERGKTPAPRHQPDRAASQRSQDQHGRRVSSSSSLDSNRTDPTNGFWRDADWLGCRDARWRPVEPGTFPLAHRAPARVGSLRGYGNAIVAPLATTFIQAVMGVLND